MTGGDGREMKEEIMEENKSDVCSSILDTASKAASTDQQI